MARSALIGASTAAATATPVLSEAEQRAADLAQQLEHAWRLFAGLLPGEGRREVVAPPRQDPETRPPLPWGVAADPTIREADLKLYERRPDDAVPREAAAGDAFMEAFSLLNPRPDFIGAAEHLRTLEARSQVVGPEGERPQVSIVIPVYGQLAYTLNCLHSLFAHHSRYSFEIIVGDDRSPDETAAILGCLSKIVLVTHPQNLGFIGNCNSAAHRARGETFVFLNNDTRVVEGWLDELVGTLEIFPQAGVVGSKLFFPDSSLQEAGGIVWRDGSAWNYGRDDDPNRPRYCYARQVDYVSGASIALPTTVWKSLGGFDAHYAPAYCEDSDLFFRVRASGRQAWMQPLSRVIHYEGKTSGTDLAQGAKAYQVVNQKKLFARWGETLATHRPNGEAPWLERDRQAKARVLVLDATTPTPDQDAGSVTTVKVIEVFQVLGYQVVFIPLHNYLYQPRYTAPLQRRGVECLYSPFVPNLEQHLRSHGEDYDVVHIFRHNVMAEVIDLIRRFAPQAKVVFNNMDLHYLRLERQAELENSDDRRDEARETKPKELRIMSRADVICVPSSNEERLLAVENLPRPVIVMPFMVDVPGARTPWAGRSNVMFLGGFAHSPNTDAALWLAEEIWPRIARSAPEAKLLIVGANPPPEIKALAGPRIEVTGRIDDLEPVLENCRVMLAPLRYGAGVKGKVYTALSHGVPVVTTAIGVEGMDVEDGSFCLEGETAEALADQTMALFNDEERWNAMSAAGLRFIEDRHTLKAGVAVMQRAVAMAVAAPPEEPERIEVSGAYDLFLRRAPTVEEEAGARQPVVDLVRDLVTSAAFGELVAAPVENGRPLEGPGFEAPPGPGLRRWAAETLPLSSHLRPVVAQARSWHDLYYRIFTDVEFRSWVLSGSERVSGAVFLAGLAHQSAFEAPAAEADRNNPRPPEDELALLRAEMAAMKASTSWRLTRPLRSLIFRARRLLAPTG